MTSLSSMVTVDVMRVKKLFQHEDNALTTSPCVEVSLVHDLVERIDDEDVRAAYVKTTRAGREEESPFLNETFTFDTTFILKALPLTELGLGDTMAGDAPGAASISLGRPPKDYAASIRFARSEREAAAAGGSSVNADGTEDPGSESGGSGANVDKHVTLHFRVLDTNKSPATLVAECRMKNISIVAAAGKAEHALTLVRREDPEVDDAGLLTVKAAVAVTKPEAQMADPDADVKLPYVPRFSGDYPLVPEERLNVAWHLSNDAAWRDRVIKAAVLAFPPEKGAPGSVKGRGGKTALGSSMKRGAGGLGASTKNALGGDDGGSDDGSGLAALVRDRWKCRRLHQLFTKFRFACERQMVGTSPLAWSPEEELTQKALWVDSAAVRNLAVTRKSKKVAAGLERSWLLYLTGDAPAEASLGATMPFEYRTKMSTATFTRTAYEAVVSSFVEMMLPPLAGASIVALIAKETYEADPAIPGTRAFKAAAALAADSAVGGDVPPAAPPAVSPPTSPLKGEKAANAAEPTSPLTPAPPAKARPGEAAFDAFKAVVTAYTDWWGETFTETEYLAQLRALDSTLLLAKQKMDAGSSAGGGGGGLLGASMRSASGKKKGGSSKKKKKG